MLNTLKYTKMTQNTERLAPIREFLNESITVNKCSHLLSKLKQKEKKLILWTAQTKVNNCAPKHYPYKRYAIKLPLKNVSKNSK